MWVLECDGDLFQGKRLWLKPGSEYLFGRTSSDVAVPNEHHHVISNKSVSRKHLVFTVDKVAPGDGYKLEVYNRSTVTLTDDSKLGTHLDGVKFVKESRTLTGKQHSIRLGSYEQTFKVTWRPVVLTFSFTDKEVRRNSAILEPYREKLEAFDIKTTHPYIIDATTHLVSTKRNIPKGLQALINGKHIVTEDFVDSIQKACAPRGVDDGISLPSALEEDYDANWPDAIKYLPGPGKEPHPRPVDKFAPNPDRISIFEGFTFVFGEKPQYEQMYPALTNGGAKTLLSELQFGKTPLDEFVKFVRSAAENKGLHDINDETTSGGVVVVRFRGKGETEQWALDFLRGLDLELGQRSVEQNEFLDAILLNDAKPLKRALEEEEEEVQPQARPSAATAPEPSAHSRKRDRETTTTFPNAALSDEATPPAPTPKAAPRGKFRRMIHKSRFKGFDDFDEDVGPIESQGAGTDAIEEDRSDTRVQTQKSSAMDVDSQPLFVSQSESQSHLPPSEVTARKELSKKRPRQAEDPQAESAAMFEQLLPGAQAMKKRRLAEQRERGVSGVSSRAESIDPMPTAPERRRKSPSALDVGKTARLHAEQLDAERGRMGFTSGAQDGHDEPIDTEDLETLASLAIVEEMNMPMRRRPAPSQRRRAATTTRQAEEVPDNRWDERWNGLKNFKQFRRKGQPQTDVGNRPRRVLVGLEEAKMKDFGIGPDYWLDPAPSRGKKNSQGQAQSQSQSQGLRTRRDVEDDRVDDPMDDNPNDEIVPDSMPPRVDAGTANATGRKRPLRVAERKQPPSKRQKQTRNAPISREDDDDDSDEDALKFRFKSRR